MRLKCKECKTEYPLEARYVCERCFGPLEVAYRHDRGLDVGRSAQDPGRARRTSGATPSSCRWTPARAVRGSPRAPACPPAARRWSAPTAWPSASAWARSGSRTTPPTRPTPSRTASSRSPLARARELGFEVLACASTGNLANAVAAHAAAAGPRVLRLHPGRPRGAEDPRHRRLRDQPGRRPRQLRRRQPPLHRALRRARLGVRQRQHAALLRRGLQDARLRDRRAARLGAARPRRRPDRLGLAVHEDRPRLRGVDRARACSRASCRPSTAPRPRAARRSRRPSRPGTTSAARSSPTRSPSRWPSATRPTAPTRSSSRAAPAARSTPSPTTRSAPASACWPRRPASSPRPPAASPPRCWRSSPSAATSTPTSASSLHHRRGPQDARRGASGARLPTATRSRSCRPWPAVSPPPAAQADRFEPRQLQPLGPPDHAQQPLRLSPDRDDEPPSRGELLLERDRLGRRRCRHVDRIEGRVPGQAAEPVAAHERHVLDPPPRGCGRPARRARRGARRSDVRGQSRQDRGMPARPGPTSSTRSFNCSASSSVIRATTAGWEIV